MVEITSTIKDQIDSMCPIAADSGMGLMTKGTTFNTVVAYGVAEVASSLDVATGIASVYNVALTLITTTAPGVGTCLATYEAPSAGSIKIFIWKPTSNSNPTFVIGSASQDISWIAVGPGS